MILLITEKGGSGTLKGILRQCGQFFSSIDRTLPTADRNLRNALMDGALRIIIIESSVDAHPCLNLLTRVKKQRPDVPVIFVAPRGADSAMDDASRCGARLCFRQPLDPGIFREGVETMVLLKQISRERRALLAVADSRGKRTPSGIPDGLPENLLRVATFIDDHSADRGLSLVRLAGIACMSPFHFCRVFKKHTRKTPMQFLNHVRVEKAKEFLRTSASHLSIAQIADAVGFYDSSNLNKHFKKATGLTPSAYKQRARSASK